MRGSSQSWPQACARSPTAGQGGTGSPLPRKGLRPPGGWHVTFTCLQVSERAPPRDAPRDAWPRSHLQVSSSPRWPHASPEGAEDICAAQRQPQDFVLPLQCWGPSQRGAWGHAMGIHPSWGQPVQGPRCHSQREAKGTRLAHCQASGGSCPLGGEGGPALSTGLHDLGPCVQ